MDTTILVESDIEKGKKVIQYLDEKGLDIKIALWLYDKDADRWHLVLSTPLVDEFGSREIYVKIAEYLKDVQIDSDINVAHIKLWKYHSSLSRLFKQQIQTGDTLSQIRFRNNIINGTFIEDAIIYRVS